MERLVTLSIQRPLAVLVSAVVVVLIAAVVGQRLRLDALPDVTPNQVQVLTTAPGLSPEEVERLVTTPVETVLGGVPGLATHRSVSRSGLSAVTAIFNDDVDPWLARQMVAERLQTVTLPDGIDRPELGPLTGALARLYSSRCRAAPGTALSSASWRAPGWGRCSGRSPASSRSTPGAALVGPSWCGRIPRASLPAA